MGIADLLPIAAFVALAAGLVVVLRGTGRIVARTRDLERFKSSTRDLAGRIDTSLGEAATQVDAVRRHQQPPDAIDETMTAAVDAVHQYTDEARGLGGPATAIPIRDAIVEELERAGRALAMVDHGRTLLGTARGPREQEAQTSIKRGYLNLLHAREAVARHAQAAAELEVDPSSGKAARRSA